MTDYLKNLFAIVILGVLLSHTTANAQFWSSKKTDLLSETDAFGMNAFVDGEQLKIQWTIAPDYYMYREQFNVSSNTPGVIFGETIYPEGVIEQDPEFGEVEVYFYSAELIIPITSFPSSGNEINLEVLGQGCNKPVGVCYPPQIRNIKVSFTPSQDTALSSVQSEPIASNNDSGFKDSSADLNKTFWGYVGAAFLIGILLSFTPCVLPMIPILLAIVAGQNRPSRLGSGLLACCYVAGHIVVYAIAGWVLGQSGSQLQAQFQNPYAIGFVCLILIVLASSLFGAFKIQLPSSFQTKLSSAKPNTKSLAVTAFILGAISSLVVGACVSPLLIVAIGAVITLGDPVLGAAVMSSLALGMGTLLIALGFGAGWLLPKAGAWMNQVQIILGFMVLAAAIFIASFVDLVPVMYFWSGLLVWFGFYLWSLASTANIEVLKAFLKGAATLLVTWGCIALLGAFNGGNDITKPLSSISLASSSNTQATIKLGFNIVTTENEAKQLLASAKADNKPVLVDFYADWCIDCKRMDRTTFMAPSVHQALNDWVLIKADVTETNTDSEALKQFFDVFGPPATLFIKGDGSEHQSLRQYGYMQESDFLSILGKAQP